MSFLECPKCGRPGYRSVYKVRSKGRTYYYEAYIHKVAGSTRRCLIRRLTPEEAERLRESLTPSAKLRRVEELEREVERLRAVVSWFQTAIVLDRERLRALWMLYVRKKGYTPQERQLARSVLHQVLSRGLEAGMAVVLFPKPNEFNTLALNLLHQVQNPLNTR